MQEDQARVVEAGGSDLASDEDKDCRQSRPRASTFLGYSFRGKTSFPDAKASQDGGPDTTVDPPKSGPDRTERRLHRINRVSVGWFAYFRHCRWNIFDEVRRDDPQADCGVSYSNVIGRNPKRLQRKQRWPNAYFTEAGFYSLRVAHIRYVQSGGQPLTGEPCAGEPHARFGGRGVRLNRTSLPLSVECRSSGRNVVAGFARIRAEQEYPDACWRFRTWSP